MRYLYLLCVLLLLSCKTHDDGDTRNYRDDMRTFVVRIAGYAHTTNADFLIVPQNGVELASSTGEAAGALVSNYLAAIDGGGQEDLFYGYDADDQSTPDEATEWLLGFLTRIHDAGKQVLVTDYCSTPSHMDDSYARNAGCGFISFAADRRELNDIPNYPALPYNANVSNIDGLEDAQNFLYLINPSEFANGDDLVAAIAPAHYDCLIIDAFIDDVPLTVAQVAALKVKPDGGRRLVLAYMSIGEAEDYRYYWQSDWSTNPPDWLTEENPDWPGNYKVRYWMPEWQAVIFGSAAAYLDRLLAAGFDGAYLDIIDAFEYFEN